ncbi:hypothetical protein HK097_006272 [Rhizophlyctis rosea]|uniref:Peptidase A1 domain-containing protein n=1 Tax=Rhizophlyctis rosea TaxID=64517 RepID=A0AAD5SCS0_9FUNG|nr:hypothetical protein HK097_006272 [Rhizophlyctis rosea]
MRTTTLVSLALLAVPSVLSANLKINGVQTRVEVEKVSKGGAKVTKENGEVLPGRIWAENGEDIAPFQLELVHEVKEVKNSKDDFVAATRRRLLVSIVYKRQSCTEGTFQCQQNTMVSKCQGGYYQSYATVCSSGTTCQVINNGWAYKCIQQNQPNVVGDGQRCGGTSYTNNRCNAGLCCSSVSYCGTTAAHCQNTSCQARFGQCGNSGFGAPQGTTTTTTPTTTTTVGVTGGVVPTTPVGSTQLYNWMSAEWSAIITINTQTNIRLMIDTGSSDLWVANTACNNCGNVPKYQFSTQTQPGTNQPYSNNLTFAYASSYLGGRTARGYAVEDLVNVGGVAVRSKFGSVWDASFINNNGMAGGILGMAFTKGFTMANRGYYNWFEEAYRAELFQKGIFGLYANPNQGSGGGDLSIGGVNPSKYRGDIMWVNVIEKYYWKVRMIEVRYDTQSIGASTLNAIVDSGTSRILGPADAVSAINSRIGGSYSSDGSFTVDCNKKNTLPPITFKLENNVVLTLTASQYILYNTVNAAFCWSAFQPYASGQALDFWVLGAPLLKKYYTAYNIGYVTDNNNGARLGFAVAYPTYTSG